MHTNTPDMDEEAHLSNLIMKTCRLSYTVCNEFIGWDFIRESTNSQDFLKNLSNELEELLVHHLPNCPASASTKLTSSGYASSSNAAKALCSASRSPR
jgi:hypothetical protein